MVNVVEDFVYSPVWGPPTGEAHCEGSYRNTSLLAEFWGCMASLCFVFIGVYSVKKAIKSHNGGEDYRFPVLYACVALTGSLSFLSHATLQYSLERIDEVVFNASVLVLVYLSWDDSMLLMFYQIHMLFTTSVTLAYPFLFHVHLVPITLALAYRIYALLRDRKQLSSFCAPVRLTLLNASCWVLALLFWCLERMHCDPNDNPWLPSLHSLCQFFGYFAFFLSIVTVHICHTLDPDSVNKGNCEVTWFPIPHITIVNNLKATKFQD